MNGLGRILWCGRNIEDGLLRRVRRLHHMRRFKRMLESVRNHETYWLSIVMHFGRLQDSRNAHRTRRLSLCAGRRSGTGLGGRPRNVHLLSIERRDDREYTRHSHRRRCIHRAHSALRDGARHNHRMRRIRNRKFGGILRTAGDFKATIDTIERSSKRWRSHDVTSVSARSSVRFARITLNALSFCGFAPASAASAAARNVAAFALRPTSARSASVERHGFVPTPPSATRAARMTPACKSTATAAEARAKAKLARSRTLI